MRNIKKKNRCLIISFYTDVFVELASVRSVPFR